MVPTFVCIRKDVSTDIFLMQPLLCWANFASPGWGIVKVSENLGTTTVVPVAPVAHF